MVMNDGKTGFDFDNIVAAESVAVMQKTVRQTVSHGLHAAGDVLASG